MQRDTERERERERERNGTATTDQLPPMPCHGHGIILQKKLVVVNLREQQHC
jgi:hypothetical protein